MKSIPTLFIAAVLAAPLTYPLAHAQGMSSMPAMSSASSSKPAAEYTEAEVRKVDVEKKQVTLKHGEIKNLGMMAMTMAFQVRDPAMLSKLKPGDKVRFQAAMEGGQVVVTEIVRAKK